MGVADLVQFTDSIYWRNPLWAILSFVPFLCWAVTRALKTNKNSYADKELMPWVTYQYSAGFIDNLFSKNTAYVLAWILMSIALSGPRLPSDILVQESPANIDIMLVVDVSRSMNASDISPNRLRRAQIEIEELLQRAGGTRIGIVMFAARPHLLVPPTQDHNALRYYLQSLDKIKLPTNGSDPVAALNLAQNELSRYEAEIPKAIILMSDGDFPNLNRQSFSKDFQEAEIPVYALAVGSKEGGAIPLETGEWLQYEGRPVISRLNEGDLKLLTEENPSKIKNDSHEKYRLATDDDSDWIGLYNEGIAKLSIRSKENLNQDILWNELFSWPLSLALMMLWVSLVPFRVRPVSLFSTRRIIKGALKGSMRERLRRMIFHRTTNTLLLMLTVISLSLYPQKIVLANSFTDIVFDGEVNNEFKKLHAYQRYNNGEYSTSALLYKDIPGFSSRLGEGNCYYKLNDYNGAIRQFGLAVLAAKKEEDRAIALFNLGNAYFQVGYYALAASVYGDALLYNPGLKSIDYNLKFSRDLIKAIEERLQSSNQFSRVGPGPRLSLSDAAINNSQSASLSIDQSETSRDGDIALPELADISNKTLENLINKGLNKIRLAAQGTSTEKSMGSISQSLSRINARLMMASLEDKTTVLWERLFEIEEGFPAPLAVPRNIPGVSPW